MNFHCVFCIYLKLRMPFFINFIFLFILLSSIFRVWEISINFDNFELIWLPSHLYSLDHFSYKLERWGDQKREQHGRPCHHYQQNRIAGRLESGVWGKKPKSNTSDHILMLMERLASTILGKELQSLYVLEAICVEEVCLSGFCPTS